MQDYKLTILHLLCFFLALLQVPVNASPVLSRRELGVELVKLARSELSRVDGFLRRDVISPKITSPDSSSVWPVGSTQVVTWDTSDFPPESQITNPIGKVILGHDSGDSLNLDFDHPLAQGFNLTDGKVNVVVPNVTPRSDYLIVLMGDSGNTSPAFAITKITGGSSSSTTPVASTTTVATSPTSTLITEPIPITGSTITGGISDTSIPGTSDTSTTPDVSTTASSAEVTSTSPVSSTTSGSAAAASTTGTSGQTSGAIKMGSRMLKAQVAVGLLAIWLAH